MAGPTQPSVTNEVWDDARIREFLALKPQDQVSGDFHMLEKAYRGMRPGDFERFLEFFIAEGRDLDAQGPDGRTLWEIIGEHRHGREFLLARSKVAG